MRLPDELLDNFKYAITDEDIPMLEEAYQAGMLAAADLVDGNYEGKTDSDFRPLEWRYVISNQIKDAADDI